MQGFVLTVVRQNSLTFLVRRKPLSAGAVCTRIKGGDFVTNRAHEYRRRAEQCLQMAVTFHVGTVEATRRIERNCRSRHMTLWRS